MAGPSGQKRRVGFIGCSADVFKKTKNFVSEILAMSSSICWRLRQIPSIQSPHQVLSAIGLRLRASAFL